MILALDCLCVNDPKRTSAFSTPRDNVTGFWWGDEGLIGKQFELLKEAVPGLERVGVVVDPDDPTTNEWLKPLPEISRALGLASRLIEVRAPTDFDAAFATATKEKLQGLQMSVSPLIVSYRVELSALAAKAQLPAIYDIREFVAAGGLMSYGTSLPDHYRRKALFVDKILVPPTCLSNGRQNSSLQSTSRPPRSSALPCHCTSNRSPTK